MAMIAIRHERSTDMPARERLLDAAFGSTRFAKTSERLREGRFAADELSFVAIENGHLVGTARFWHVAAGAGRAALLLGPVAVAMDARGRGIGSTLIKRALRDARRAGHRAVLLVGDAPYYGRFGFAAELTGTLKLPGPCQPERFLGLELISGALAGARGLVRPTGQCMPKGLPAFLTGILPPRQPMLHAA
jgi:predicted N-acetyltransferase YhbS